MGKRTQAGCFLPFARKWGMLGRMKASCPCLCLPPLASGKKLRMLSARMFWQHCPRPQQLRLVEWETTKTLR